MTGMQSLNHEFVQFMPADLADGVLYVSIPFVTAMHLCCCGCGNEVVTPLNPDAWRLAPYVRRGVRLPPSVHQQSRSGLPVTLLDNSRQGVLGTPVVCKETRESQ